MATTEAAHSAVNGTYHPNPYAAEHYNPAHHAANYNAQPSNPPLVQANEPKNDVTKDEVGWFFVEQYYTTLSRSPDKLHLFYSRRSQFVFGVEAEKVPVAVGQKVCAQFSCRHQVNPSNAPAFVTGYPRAPQGTRLPRLQGPRLECRLPGFVR